jgi:ketosteroid isomerase-like protein
MSQGNVEAVRRGFKLWDIVLSDPDDAHRQEALKAMTAVYSPDAVIDFSRTTPDYPAAKGPQGMLAWMDEAGAAFVDARVEMIDAVDAGDNVVASARISGRGSASGVPVVFTYAYVFGFTNGQVVSAVSYETFAAAREAVELSE